MKHLFLKSKLEGMPCLSINSRQIVKSELASNHRNGVGTLSLNDFSDRRDRFTISKGSIRGSAEHKVDVAALSNYVSQ